MGTLRYGRIGGVPPGRSQINVPGLTQTAYPFMNFLKGVLQRKPQSTILFQSLLDTNGYPNNGPVPAGSSNYLGGQIFLPSSYGTGLWRLGWSGTGFEQVSGVGITVTANSGASINGTPGATGVFASGVIISGTNPAITFFFTGGVPSAAVTFNWTSGTYTNMAAEYLVRDSDWTTFQAGGINSYFTPEFLSFYTTLKPKTIRFMDWSAVNNCNIAKFAHQPPVGTASFSAPRWVPDCFAGATTNSGDDYSVSAPAGWGGLVQGATAQLQFNSANTTTSPTLNVGGTGAKAIISLRGVVLTAGTITANLSATVVYDATTGKWQYIGSGFTSASGFAVPLDYQIALCNLVYANMWNCFPIMYDGTEAAAMATAIKAGLNSNLSFYAEVANEVWGGFWQTGYCGQLGTAFGVTSTSNRHIMAGYGLKVCQLLGAARAAWGASDPRFIGVMAVQAFNAQTASIGGINDLYRLQGGDLNGTTYPNYAAAGFPNYDTAPNRPVDNCQSFAYATYFAGAQCADGQPGYLNPLTVGGPNTGPNTGLLGAADLYNSGAGSPSDIATAFAFLDWDFRTGISLTKAVTSISSTPASPVIITASSFVQNGNIVAFYTSGTFDAAITAGKNYFVVNVSGGTFQISNTLGGAAINVVSGASTGTIKFGVAGDQQFGGGQTMLVFNSGATGLSSSVRGVYPAWNALAATYNLTVDLYEGGFDAFVPTDSYCTGTLGLSPGYGTIGSTGLGGKISDLLVAYKGSSLFQQLITDQYTQFMAQSQSRTPSQYGIIANPASNAQFALRTPDLFGSNWKSYDAIQAYNA